MKNKYREQVLEKLPAIKELTQEERRMLFLMIESFQEAAQQTIIGGEGLLKMCDGCAFKKGAEGNIEPLTALKATECVLREDPFYCHKRFCPSGSEKICNGWINIMNNK